MFNKLFSLQFNGFMKVHNKTDLIRKTLHISIHSLEDHDESDIIYEKV